MLTTDLESLLFAAAKPVSAVSLRKLLLANEQAFDEAVADIRRRFNVESSGIHLLEHEGQLQFVTSPSSADVVAKFLKEDQVAELTRPSLEALAVIAYRGPITKPELEQIRGVNCALILRNLMMHGLIDEKDDVARLQPVYAVSTEFLRYLGASRLDELPQYGELHANERIDELVRQLSAEPSV